MQTGRFINKLVNDRESFFQTDGAEKLLNKTNFMTVWNLSNQGPGEYENKFLDDMAITNTIISIVAESGGRIIHENDTIIIKFDESDREQILDMLIERLNLLRTMSKLQHNNEELVLMNPLPEVKF